MPNTNTDQIRQLENQVHLAGYLAELSEMRTGTTTNGVPYMSFSGAIQCGEDAVYTVPFRTFVKSKKSDGSDSKNFAKVQDWYAQAVPKTKDPENPTMVSCFGSITDNPYVNSQGKLVEATQFNIQSFNPFKDFQCDIDLEGFLLCLCGSYLLDFMKSYSSRFYILLDLTVFFPPCIKAFYLFIYFFY